MALTPETLRDFLAKHILIDVVPLVIDLEKSQGNRLYSIRHKHSFLDCFSYVASNPIGHNHPKMFEPEFEKKLLKIARTKPSNSDFLTIEYGEFIETLARVAMPKELQHLFLISGGTLAVENALKAAFDWKVRLNMQNGIGGKVGSQVLHFREAFHGRSGYCLSLTNTADPRKYKHFPKFDWPRVSNPKVTFPLIEKNLQAVKEAEKKSVMEIEAAFRERGDDIAAIIIEPIQAEGGDNHFRKEFHQALRNLADKHEAMLIYDEVQTGVGITGKMWAYEHYGIVPDMVCFGKKMQVCGIFVGSRIEKVKENVFVEKSRLNSTWGGDLTSMVRAKRYLEIIEEEKLVENARITGAALLKGLQELETKFPEHVSNARGLGLMCAIDFTSPEARNDFVSKLFERKILALVCGTRSLRLRPSLTFSKEEVSELLAGMEDALSGFGKKVSQ